jgi:hypothetical protein
VNEEKWNYRFVHWSTLMRYHAMTSLTALAQVSVKSGCAVAGAHKQGVLTIATVSAGVRAARTGGIGCSRQGLVSGADRDSCMGEIGTRVWGR